MVKKQDEVIKTGKEYLKLVMEIFPVAGAWLYGSYSRNEQNEWSDIDIAICSPDFEHIPRPIAIKILSKIAKRIDYAIEPYPLRPTECTNKVIGTLANEILATGLQL